MDLLPEATRRCPSTVAGIHRRHPPELQCRVTVALRHPRQMEDMELVRVTTVRNFEIRSWADDK